MKSFFWGLLFVLIVFACRDKDSGPKGGQSTGHWQKAVVWHDTLDVRIPIEGKLIAWKRVDVLSPLKARLVSLLVEPGDRVHSGDLILSLWPLQAQGNFSTVDLHAPLNGVVRRVYHLLNDTIPKNKPILTIENRENLILKTTLSRAQMGYVKPDLNAVLHYGQEKIKGAVWKVDKSKQQVTIVVPNQQLGLSDDRYVDGYIDLGKQAGSFLARRYFGPVDSLKVRTSRDSLFTVQKIGIAADSLILLYPDLREFKAIEVKKILTL